jgi:hypothetical protein
MKLRTVKGKSLVCLALILFFISLPAVPQQSATNASESALLQALLEEVRQLRIATERSSAIAPRMQLTIARFQMQQERVDRQERELEIVKNQLSTESMGRERLLATLRQYDEQARQSADPVVKKQFEDGASAARSELEQQSLREQAAQQQQATIMDRLATEQAKLTDLIRQLDKLDKALQPQ